MKKRVEKESRNERGSRTSKKKLRWKSEAWGPFQRRTMSSSIRSLERKAPEEKGVHIQDFQSWMDARTSEKPPRNPNPWHLDFKMP